MKSFTTIIEFNEEFKFRQKQLAFESNKYFLLGAKFKI